MTVLNPLSICPVKQKRALLESNPPRDNWIEGDEIKSVSTFGEANTSPKALAETLYFRAEHALKTHRSRAQNAPYRQPKTHGKKCVSILSQLAFHAEPVQYWQATGTSPCFTAFWWT